MKDNVETPDGDLVRQFAQGREQAFEVIVRRHQSRLYTASYLILRDRYEAEDVVQETFLKACQTIRSGKYNEEGKLLPWLMRIAHNKCIDRTRRRKRSPEVILEDGSPIFRSLRFASPTVEDETVAAERGQILRAHIMKLPTAQREVLMLRHFAGMSFREIADHTQVSINTALGRMRYALINLRKSLERTPEFHQELAHKVGTVRALAPDA